MNQLIKAYLSFFLLGAFAFYSCAPSHRFTYQARKERLQEKNDVPSGNYSTGNEGESPVYDGKGNLNSSNQKFETIVAKAKTFIGTPHVLGGNNYEGIDCSGLIAQSYQAAGISLPRTTGGQAKMGRPVGIEKLEVGDLVFFSSPYEGKIVHVGLISSINGENDVTFIHASASKGVREDQLYSNYWIKIYVKARRIL